MAQHHQVSDTEIFNIIKEFDIEADNWQHISAGDTNTSYLLSDAGQDPSHILTLLNQKVMNPARLRAIIAHVAVNGVNVAVPLLTKAGEPYFSYDEQRAMVKPFVAGSCSNRLPADKMIDAGALLARIHSLPLTSQLERCNSRGLEINQLAEIASLASNDYSQWLQASLSATDYIEEAQVPQGFVHGDFWSDNIVVTPENQLVAIDWDNAAVGSFIYDIAFALNGLLQDGTQVLDRPRLDSFFAGYESVRVLTPEEKKTFPDALLRASALISGRRFYRHYIRFPDPSYHDPEKYGKYAETMFIGQAADTCLI